MEANNQITEGMDLAHGEIRKELWNLAWPMMLSMFFYTLYNVVDAYWVSKLSAEAIAAVSISQITLFIMISLGFGVTVGSGVIMAMHIGAENKKEAERVLGQSFVLSGILAIIFTIIALVFSRELLIFSGAAGAIFEPALIYYNITAAGSILMFLLMAIMFAFNSQGDTATLTKLFALSTVVNAVLDPIMIFGWFNTPAFGIAGAAYATLISQLVFIVFAIKSLNSPHRQIRFHFYNLSFQWESVKKVLNIGFPAALSQIVFPVGIALLTYIITLGFQEAGGVAFSLGFRVEFFAFLPAVGFGFAGMAMMGQSLGAGNKERAITIFNAALKYAFIGAVALGIFAAVFAGPLVGLFTDDPKVTEYTFSYLWTVTLSYGFLAALMVETSSFQAVNKSWPGFWLFVLRAIVITLPLSYILTQYLNIGILGIWIAVILGNVISAVVGYFWIKKELSKLDLKNIPVHHMQNG